MRAGTIVFEEHAIQFRILMSGRVEYIVENTVSGASALKEVEASAFGAALRALFVGTYALDDRAAELAEEAMPVDYNVRFSGQASPEELTVLVAAVRWID